MRRITFILMIAAMATGCGNRNPKEQGTKADTTGTARQPGVNDSTLLRLSTEILNTIKKKDYQGLAAYIHPEQGLRLSPYAFIDTVNDVVIYKNALVKDLDKLRFWGNYDGSGDPIEKNTPDYFSEFVYDKDFVTEAQKAVNDFQVSGNSANNIKGAYPGLEFTEYYIEDKTEATGGMGWKVLRLVFRQEGGHFYLVGIVHDQWTI